MKRALSLLLALCMLASIGSPAAWANDPSPSPEEETEAVLRLPTSLKTIEAEAFFGDTSLGEVVLPDEIESIGRNAFTESSLKKINLPDSLKSIDDTALPPPGTVIVTADEGSTAYNWAVENKYIAALVAINATNFPDDNFRAYVAGFDTDSDEILSAAEIAAVTWINVSYQNIADLTGVEHFTALTTLYCDNNQLTELNVSGCAALTNLLCFNNQLKTLDVSGNTALSILICYGNQLTALNLSANTALYQLDCGSNQLTALDVSTNTALIWLNCQGNQLTALNLSTNTAMEDLDVSDCTALTGLDVSGNHLKSLYVRNCSALSTLSCSGNQLTTLDLSGCTALTRLDCSGNPLTKLYGINCPNLLAAVELGVMSVNEGENVRVFVYQDFRFSLPADAELVLTPPDPIAIDETNFPDADFRADVAICDMNRDNVLSWDEIAAVTEIYLDGQDITDLKGIEHFTALTTLYCSGKRLTELNLSANTALRELYCDNNQLTALDVSANTALTELRCYNNNLTELDVTHNPALTILLCADNQLKALDVSRNPALDALICADNDLAELHISANTALEYLNCGENQLTALDISNCPFLVAAYREGPCSNYPGEIPSGVTVYCGIEMEYVLIVDDSAKIIISVAINEQNFPDANFRAWVTDNCDTNTDGILSEEELAKVTEINVSYQNIADLTGVEHFTALTELDCYNNQLTELNVSGCTALTGLYCYSNQLTTLDVSGCTALTELDCAYNQLTTLDVSGCTALRHLGCGNNSGMQTLDVSACPSLVEAAKSTRIKRDPFGNVTYFGVNSDLGLSRETQLITGDTIAEPACTALTLDTWYDTAEDSISPACSWFRFTPTESGNYSFRSSACEGVSAVNFGVYDSAWNCVSYGDSQNGDSFYRTVRLQAGETYSFGVFAHNYSYNGGVPSFQVQLSQAANPITAYVEADGCRVVYDGSNETARWYKVYTPLNETVTVEAVASGGSSALNYAWSLDWETIEDAHDSSYTLTVSGSNNLTATISDDSGQTYRLYITVMPETHLEAWPANYQYTVPVESGQTAELRVEYECDTEVQFQWNRMIYQPDLGYYYLEPVENGTSNTLTVGPITEAEGYVCFLTDIYGGETSVQITACPDAHLRVQQVGKSTRKVNAGETVTLSLDVSCDEPVSYSWSRYFLSPGNNYYSYDSSFSADTESITTAPVTQDVMYQCYVRAASGQNTYASFTITPINHLLLGITADQALNRERYRTYVTEVEPGGSLTLTASACADDMEGLRFEWGYEIYENGYGTEFVALSEGPVFSLTDIQEAETYTCRVTDRYQNSLSSDVVVLIANGLQLDGTQEYTVAYGETATLSVEATATDSDDMQFTWEEYKRNYGYVTVDGADGATLTTEPVTEQQEYRCTVTDRFGNQKSLTIDVQVENHLSLVAQCGELTSEDGHLVVTVPYGEPVTVSLLTSADDSSDMTYKWYKAEEDEEYENWSFYPDDSNVESTLHLDAVTELTRYECDAMDRFGNYAWVTVVIAVENNLQVDILTPCNEVESDVDTMNCYYSTLNEVSAVPGEELTLALQVTADDMTDLQVQWYKVLDLCDVYYGYAVQPVGNESSLVLTAAEPDEIYTVCVMDRFGNRCFYGFHIIPDA